MSSQIQLLRAALTGISKDTDGRAALVKGSLSLIASMESRAKAIDVPEVDSRRLALMFAQAYDEAKSAAEQIDQACVKVLIYAATLA